MRKVKMDKIITSFKVERFLSKIHRRLFSTQSWRKCIIWDNDVGDKSIALGIRDHAFYFLSYLEEYDGRYGW